MRSLLSMIFLLLIPILNSWASTAQSSAQAIVGTKVIIGTFAIDATEVTIGQLQQRLNPADSSTKAEKEGGGYEYAAGWEQRTGWVWHTPYGKTAELDEPVVHITWFEAGAHCRSVGGRLPTLDEWQLAAYTERREEPTDGFQRGKQYSYPVGDDPEGMNTNGDDAWENHAPAGVTKRGVNGLYDMGANAWEWIADSDGDRALTAGGSWWYSAEKTRATGAQYKAKDFAAVYIGFRCLYPLDVM